VTVTRTTERSIRDRVVLWGLVGAGAIGVGLGVGWHLDSRDAAEAVSADDGRLVGTWSDELQERYDEAGRAGSKATVAYAVGGTLLIGAFGWAYWTRPRERQVVLVPVEGGATARATWRF
jgi:hypothetical protein